MRAQKFNTLLEFSVIVESSVAFRAEGIIGGASGNQSAIPVFIVEFISFGALTLGRCGVVNFTINLTVWLTLLCS